MDKNFDISQIYINILTIIHLKKQLRKFVFILFQTLPN